jgi:trehalose 6-phosphate phosphatase
MRHILAKRHSHKLAEFASSNVLIAFDYDGTLAPIVPQPSLARMRPTTRRLLAAVARRYPCVVISGRARQDLARRVGAVPVWHLAGNYGLEPWAQDAAYPAQVKEWVRQLERTLPAHQGIAIENKTYSATIHYRQAKHQRRAVKAIKQAVSALRGARILGGKHAISLVPRDAPSKGIALERARRLLACDTAIYVGDDDTDEEAFVAGRPDRLLGVRIGARARSRARYHLKRQEEIDDFLETLLEFRPLRGRLNGRNFPNGR